MFEKIIKGNISYINDDKGFLPLRFTQNQIDVYSKFSALCAIRAYCPAGMYLNFKTKDYTISFDYLTESVARDWYCFDIYEEDVFIQRISGEKYLNGKNTITYILKNPHKNPEIKIFLPHANKIYLSNFIGEVTPINVDKTKYLALGDSITQGMESHSPSLCYASQIANFFDFDMLNQGVGGYIFDHNTIDEKLPFHPTLLTVAYGTNDFKTVESLKTIEESIKCYFKKLRNIYKDAKIIILTPIFREELRDKQFYTKMIEVRMLLEKYAEEYQMFVINGGKLHPEIKEFFGDERLHPSGEGSLYMSLNIIKELLKILL